MGIGGSGGGVVFRMESGITFLHQGHEKKFDVETDRG